MSSFDAEAEKLFNNNVPGGFAISCPVYNVALIGRNNGRLLPDKEKTPIIDDRKSEQQNAWGEGLFDRRQQCKLV